MFNSYFNCVLLGLGLSVLFFLTPHKMTTRSFQLRPETWIIFFFLSSVLLSLLFLLSVNVRYDNIYKSSLPTADNLTFHRYNINCLAIYDLDPVEVEKALIIKENQLVEDTDESLSVATSNCPLFIKTRGYDVCVSEEEKDFPIAYSLVVHKYAWMVERLIKAIYSPANIYCIHYDEKSPASFKSAIKSFASCLPNVFIASKIEYVYYASFNRVQADLNCFSDLLRSEVKWKYLINLCGQDFPLRTNIELVSELKELNGANMLETSRPPDYKKMRYTHHYKLMENSDLNITDQLKSPPPHGIEMFVGNAYFVLSRDFIVYMNSSAVVKDFLKWSEDTFSPDEHIWATLVRMPGVPGEVPRSHPDITDLMSKTRLVKWSDVEEEVYPPCTGKYVRNVCIFGTAEIRWLLNCGQWFANKFDTEVDPVAIQCLEEKLEERKKWFQSAVSPTCT
ncbi:beta-1%2C3-galactosyl-O-glycosyl-glycoprotein beta-1,6-N-acetylglucosaminyltransferase 4-like [Xyrichtys novacula]|uniref:Beta-1,3-galactosyl-O-glycosyl-glycoprotein beta-1,6-N-acetylglucosaminyltransferase 4-like n=1 Tax=Xyrichtys novacula TaxID=13765 RepID=A0AAV1GAM0_XYRNO|nr:beta-1%2C3-galactosyl-O-glycosyl-glycoprotein beta-1,6-N-acetylglucosaminyltransferase 4-like [Xyrichtys novacula]